MNLRTVRLGLVSAFLLAACGGKSEPAPADGVTRQPLPPGVDSAMVEWRSDGVIVASPDSLRKLPGYVVDSVFPMPESIRRFQAATPGPAPEDFTGGRATAEGLVRDYWKMLVAEDTVGVQGLALSRAEFAWLYYPGSGEETSGLQPHIAWRLFESTSPTGLLRARKVAAGARGPVREAYCRGTVITAGLIRSMGPCGVVIGPGRDSIEVARRVVERKGVFKLLSFANAL